ncbi:hypothetical protein K435DRAFT_748008 [Dendrothele bispora CBS 962.96]|uniref:Uncharacterized protein n=1 Tax=Dendrothele bispora (strain CBS 962.96) TaxID=1314807 RepID=A0A4S8MM69_DENBC|nr:hypothetical protein K435DRAFT_748008 [Dendrothele bispora CBS 962.96]
MKARPIPTSQIMQRADSRPITPESDSQLANSLDIAANTIDDLTLALANFSRVSSPEPPSSLTCCCGRPDCENTLAWQAKKSRLESRLTLSAQVGQALLQRHEAYVRKHEVRDINFNEITTTPIQLQTFPDNQASTDDDTEDVDSRVSELLKEKHTLEKRLTQALVNNEVTEVSSKTLLQELQEARTTISRLSTSHAKSVGWETRLSAAMKEKDDMQQERDFESQRARLAESRFAALKERTLKLQADVRRLQDELEEKRQHRLEESESNLQDARSRIESLNTKIGSLATPDHSEITSILESLVDDNEGLKRDNAELQALLAESRDDLYALQQEVEEQRVNQPNRPSRATTPLGLQFKQHYYSGSMPSNLLKEPQSSQKKGRPSSLERRGFGQRPLTPDTTHLPLSPTDSTAASESRFSSYSQPLPRYPTSPYEIEIQVDEQEDEIPAPPEKTRYHKPLFLLTRSRGVQTESPETPLPSSGKLSPIPVPTPSPHDPRSESSSFSESTASNMAILIERVVQLLNRMAQSDALTLTNRLKRQHLRGADVGHLSRSTVNNILSEAAGLRNQFRYLLEDEKTVTLCNRKDLRAFFKLIRDLFVAMGEMRVTLNDVILDPSIAPRISELALDPAKAEAEKRRAQKDGNAAVVGAWIAPITKLFGAPVGRSSEGQDRSGTPSAGATLTRSVSGRETVRPPRFVPKLGPALSASATTVNVEFSGSGTGRATTSTSAASPANAQASSSSSSRPPPPLTSKPSMNVMGIFAGAPAHPSSEEPWVKIPKRVVSLQTNEPMAPSPYRQATIPSPTTVRASHQHRMSRNVDAVVDLENSSRVGGDSRDDEEDEEPDRVGPLLERTLRRRGLSDSSIHSTYIQGDEDGGDESQLSPQRITAGAAAAAAWSTPMGKGSGSVLQTLSKRMQNFRLGVGSGSGYGVQDSPTRQTSSHRHHSGGGVGILPTLGNWAAANAAAVDMGGSESLMAVGSPRDESSMFQREPHGLSRHGPGGDFF